ncbi:carbon-nitrogen hydrolase family protein [Nitrincola sp. MINF-07-Sa-05]|uniref:carbon-nitrogen hydrolase family protein n=1 Tax=Nitrincola salilacus TaxID=3400273 RepID=UPI003918237F
MKAGVIQMVSGAELEQNLEQAERLIADAARGACTLALLPENFAIFDSRQMRSVAELEDTQGRLTEFLTHSARVYGIWLVAGSIPALRDESGEVLDRGRVRSRCLVVDSDGEICCAYDKRHLFDVDVGDAQQVYRESDWIEPGGDDIQVIDTPVGRLGLSICYDLRFPEHYQRLLAAGAQVISVPSAFTWKTGKAHWKLLLRARACETQCYVLGANQGGRHSETRETWGHSMIVDPWGKVLARCKQGPALVMADIDLEYLAQIRQRMPVQQHRRD